MTHTPDVLFSLYFTTPCFSLARIFSPPPPHRVNACPNNCSGRGECRVGNATGSVRCACDDKWKGEACDVPYCAADCGYPQRGRCQGKTCVCKDGWQGGCVGEGEGGAVRVTLFVTSSKNFVRLDAAVRKHGLLVL